MGGPFQGLTRNPKPNPIPKTQTVPCVKEQENVMLKDVVRMGLRSSHSSVHTHIHRSVSLSFSPRRSFNPSSPFSPPHPNRADFPGSVRTLHTSPSHSSSQPRPAATETPKQENTRHRPDSAEGAGMDYSADRSKAPRSRRPDVADRRSRSH